MACALWATLAVLTGTGLVMTGGRTPMRMDDLRARAAEGDGSVLAGESKTGDEDSGRSETAEEVHEVAGNPIFSLVLPHVAGAVAQSRALRRNLVRPMHFGPRE